MKARPNRGPGTTPSTPTPNRKSIGERTQSHTEALVRIEAAQRLLCHGLTDGTTYPLTECAEQAVVLLDQADRYLSVRSAVLRSVA